MVLESTGINLFHHIKRAKFSHQKNYEINTMLSGGPINE